MRPIPLLTTLFLTTITTTHAAAETTIHNKCPFPVYYASVDSTAPDHTTELRPKDYILQDQWFDGKTGTALKITTTKNGMWAGEPVLNFAYTVKDDEVYYDLSTGWTAGGSACCACEWGGGFGAYALCLEMICHGLSCYEVSMQAVHRS
jgi:hypothetical protein